MINIVCLKCQSTNVMTGIGLVTNTSDGKYIADLFIDEEPDAIIFKPDAPLPSMQECVVPVVL